MDLQPGEKLKIKAKINRLSDQLKEKEKALELQYESNCKNAMLSKIKLEEYKKELTRMSTQNPQEVQQPTQHSEKIRYYQDFINTLDNEIQQKDKLIIKLQWSKGEVKD